MTQKTPEEALTRLTAYCAASEHCLHDVRVKLQTWNIDSKKSRDIINYLIENKFVDEARYCRAYANDRFRYSGHGRLKIAAALRAKHLPEEHIEAALDLIDEEEYTQKLEELLRSKRRTTHAPSKYQLQAKLFRFAQSRGYESSLISEILRQEE